MQAPSRFFELGGEIWEFRADMLASYAYAELTGGGLEDAFHDLKPFFRLSDLSKEIAQLTQQALEQDLGSTELVQLLGDKEAELQRLLRSQHDPRPWLRLAYAMSVRFRQASGFDRMHWVPEDADKHPLDRNGFQEFVAMMPPYALRCGLRDRILELFSEAITPPTMTGTVTATPEVSVSS